jgi:hypothetical protein
LNHKWAYINFPPLSSFSPHMVNFVNKEQRATSSAPSNRNSLATITMILLSLTLSQNNIITIYWEGANTRQQLA